MKPSKKLIDKWYGKLAKSGFEDIEDNLGYNNVNRHHASDFGRQDAELVAIKQEYYYLATQYLHANTFKVAFDRKVWELHAEGETVRSIAAKLKASTKKVQTSIAYHRAAAGLRREIV